jgi:hypothetical protein
MAKGQFVDLCRADCNDLKKNLGDGDKKKVKYVYKSADQILEEGKWRKVSTSIGASSLPQAKVRFFILFYY